MAERPPPRRPAGNDPRDDPERDDPEKKRSDRLDTDRYPVVFRPSEETRVWHTPHETTYMERFTEPVPPRRDEIVVAKAIQVIWYFIGVLEVLLGLRFLLKLVGADPSNAFASLLYAVSGIFQAPFEGIVRNPRIGDSIIELDTLIAMTVYLLIGLAIVKFLRLLVEPAHPM